MITSYYKSIEFSYVRYQRNHLPDLITYINNIMFFLCNVSVLSGIYCVKLLAMLQLNYSPHYYLYST